MGEEILRIDNNLNLLTKEYRYKRFNGNSAKSVQLFERF